MVSQFHYLQNNNRQSFTESAEQTFGVDLEARARADRKRVPIIVTTILTFLDNRKFHLQLDTCRLRL